VEGVASSVALVERLLQKQQQQQGKTATAAETNATTTTTTDRSILSELSNDDEIWDHAANALASLCATLLLLLSVERIVLGGGILKRDGLLRKIQARTVVLLNGYLQLPPPLASSLSSKSNDDNGNDESIVTLEQLITTSVHGDNAGLQGAIVLAQRAYYQDRYRSAVATPAIKKDDDDDDDTRKDDNKKNDSFLAPDMKRQAFQIGWTFGMLVGAVGTALLMRYHGGAKRR
jgi:predicted NBD/HSP70 family sugar kinase